jgi:hypothetical protein
MITALFKDIPCFANDRMLLIAQIVSKKKCPKKGIF